MAFTDHTLPILANWSQFISGFTIIGGFAGIARHINCHEKKCWRIGKHPLTGTPYKYCRRHHPQIP